jgi:hypothetical protein
MEVIRTLVAVTEVAVVTDPPLLGLVVPQVVGETTALTGATTATEVVNTIVTHPHPRLIVLNLYLRNNGPVGRDPGRATDNRKTRELASKVFRIARVE